MADTKKKLIDLIDYVDHLVRLGEKPVFNIKSYKQLTYHEVDLRNRIGIEHNLSSDEGQIWLKIERLQRIDPPSIPDKIENWVAVRNFDELIDLCESGFERKVFRRLVDLGYRVKPQVKVGPYSIDLVVEGSEDRRLAIELDGDQYHTPDRWADDYARQSVLERVGWQFWRCWGSSFIMDSEGCIQDLVETLNNNGIEPVGYESESQAIYTEHRVLDRQYELDEKDKNVDTRESKDRRTVYEQLGLPLDKKVDPSKSEFIVSQETVSPKIEGIREEGIGIEDLMVEVGDQVLISYNDEPNLQHTIKISATQHDPDMKIIRKNMPLAQALLKAEVNEEIEIPAGGGTRIITILNIEKGEKS